MKLINKKSPEKGSAKVQKLFTPPTFSHKFFNEHVNNLTSGKVGLEKDKEGIRFLRDFPPQSTF
jgi:hypothetical protein